MSTSSQAQTASLSSAAQQYEGTSAEAVQQQSNVIADPSHHTSVPHQAGTTQATSPRCQRVSGPISHVQSVSRISRCDL